jgi:hypothetical protein
MPQSIEAAALPTRPEFVYEPLKGSDFTIRLLEVLSAESECDIKLRIWERTRDEQYRCLSYTWSVPFPEVRVYTDASERDANPLSSSADSHGIVVNGRRFNVGTNLYRFLELARRKYPNTPLWIDAICINQKDDHEKGQQVARMADILL